MDVSLLDPRDPSARPQIPRVYSNLKHHLSTGTIVGIAVGSATGVIAMIMILVLCRRRQRMNNSQHDQDSPVKPSLPIPRSSEPGRWKKPVELPTPCEIPCLSDDLNSVQRQELSPTTLRNGTESPFSGAEFEEDSIEAYPPYTASYNVRPTTAKRQKVSVEEKSQLSWLNTTPEPHQAKIHSRPSLPIDKPLPSVSHGWHRHA